MIDHVAICLTADRQELTERAVRCFRKQTYPARMLIYDTGREPFKLPAGENGNIRLVRNAERNGAKIGELRNDANYLARTSESQIYLHWDSDDWYDPEHIETLTVALQQRRGLAFGCVGYREALFYQRETREAWKYTHPSESYVIGASMCYWASCWDQRPFEATANNTGEDLRWIRHIKTLGREGYVWPTLRPLMVVELHGGNTSSHLAFKHAGTPHDENWKRATDWDETARTRMESK